MKRIVLVLLVVVVAMGAKAQQLPLVTNYQQHMFNWNPAAAGAMDMWSTRASFRGEWLRFPGSPLTETISINGPLKDTKLGVGFSMYNDRVGEWQNYGAGLAVSYAVELGEADLRLGLGTKFSRPDLDNPTTLNPEPVDLRNLVAEQFIADISLGAFLQAEKAYVGLSLLQLGQITNNEAAAYKMHIALMGGYMHKFSSDLTLEPSGLIKVAPGTSPQLDVNVKAHVIEEQLYFGAGLRALGGTYASLMLGGKLDKKYHFGYAYDMGLNKSQQWTRGGHEVFVGWDFHCKPKADEPEIDGGDAYEVKKEKKAKS